MTIHSSILPWRIPWTEELNGLQFMELQRVGRDWSDEHFHITFNFQRTNDPSLTLGGCFFTLGGGFDPPHFS